MPTRTPASSTSSRSGSAPRSVTSLLPSTACTGANVASSSSSPRSTTSPQCSTTSASRSAAYTGSGSRRRAVVAEMGVGEDDGAHVASEAGHVRK